LEAGPVETIRAAAYAASVAAMALLLSACAAATPQAASASAATRTPRAAEHIYVTEGSLNTACYQEVGEVGYVESFAAAVTDPEHIVMADTLRKAAVRKYPNRVDAIINVHTQDHDIGSEVLVSGEAVQLESPDKIDCKLPKTIATALSGFATGIRSDVMRETTSDQGFNGPADTASYTQGSSEADSGTGTGRNYGGIIAATKPGQARPSDATPIGQVRLRQAEIERLRNELDSIISQRCEAANVSAVQCDSIRRGAELKEPPDAIAVANRKADEKSTPSAFEIQNALQAQDELIARLRGRIDDLNEAPLQAAGAGSSN
jgi:hypothetical protein